MDPNTIPYGSSPWKYDSKKKWPMIWRNWRDTKVFGSGLNGDGFCWMGIYADG